MLDPVGGLGRTDMSSVFKLCDGFRILYPGQADFLIHEDGRSIGVCRASGISTETSNHFLLDQVLPRVLAHLGRLVVHAGAVRVGDKAIAFLGESGSGKSTLTAAFQQQGNIPLSDDALVVDADSASIGILPTYPSLRLWPDSIEVVFDRTPRLAAMDDNLSKRRVKLDNDAPDPDEPVPLAAIFVLRQTEASEGDGALITPLSPRESCMAIIGNSFRLEFSDRERSSRLFSNCGRIADRVPTYMLSCPRDYGILPAVVSAILGRQNEWKKGFGGDRAAV